jgi:hypothetical protein
MAALRNVHHSLKAFILLGVVHIESQNGASCSLPSHSALASAQSIGALTDWRLELPRKRDQKSRFISRS